MKLLWLSDSPTRPTGFGTVGRHLLRRLAATGEYQILALGRDYDPAAQDPALHPYPLFPFGANLAAQVDDVCLRFQPDGIVTLGDPWEYGFLASPSEARTGRPWIAYVTVDSGPLPTECRAALRAADRVVVSSQYGAEVIQAGLPNREPTVIPFGVDSQIFRPLPQREDLRAEHGLADRFVVGFVGRNQPRKQLPLLLQAFADFAPEVPEAFLYLHTDPTDEAGWDLYELIQRYGIADRCGFTPEVTAGRGIPDPALNALYNLFDVFVLPSNGEGFGRPLVEAMAAGVPVITTDASTNRELVSGQGELIAVYQTLVSGVHNLELPLPDRADLVAKLRGLWQDPDRRAAYRQAGRSFAEGRTWEACAEAWHALLQEVGRPAKAARRPVPDLAVCLLWPAPRREALRRWLESAPLDRAAGQEVFIVAPDAPPEVRETLAGWEGTGVRGIFDVPEGVDPVAFCAAQAAAPTLVVVDGEVDLTPAGLEESVQRVGPLEGAQWQHGRRIVPYRLRSSGPPLLRSPAPLLPCSPAPLAPLVVVLPTRNRAPFLEEMLENLRRQTFQDFRLIVVDDGSTDATPNLLAQLRDERLTTVRTAGQGVAAARNLGNTLAPADAIIVEVDDDDRLAPEALQQIADAFLDPRVDFVYADCAFLDAAGQPLGPPYRKPEWQPGLLAYDCFIIGVRAYRRAWWKRVGGLRSEEYPAEDYGLFLRMEAAGARFRRLPQVLYQVRDHPHRTTRQQVAAQRAMAARLGRRFREGTLLERKGTEEAIGKLGNWETGKLGNWETSPSPLGLISQFPSCLPQL